MYLSTGQGDDEKADGFCVGMETANSVSSSKLKALWGKHCVRTFVGKHSPSNTELETLWAQKSRQHEC